MRIRTVIVDDEPWARTNLRLLLGTDQEIELVGECGSVDEAKRVIEVELPELLFLDVQLKDGDGFDVLEGLGCKAPRAIVFVTAYDQFALRAFEVAALDYLMKPFDNERFFRALDRAKGQLKQRSEGGRLIVRSAGKVAFLKVSEIDWIEAADYYSCLYVGCKTHLMRKALAELERELPPAQFCRIHRSRIVNLDRILEMRSDAAGEQQVILRDGSALRVSRSYKTQLAGRLESEKSK